MITTFLDELLDFFRLEASGWDGPSSVTGPWPSAALSVIHRDRDSIALEAGRAGGKASGGAKKCLHFISDLDPSHDENIS